MVPKRPKAPEATNTPNLRLLTNPSGAARYGMVLLSVLLALLLRLALAPLLGEAAPLLIFIMPVVISAWFGGAYPGLFATLLGGIAGSYFFVTPSVSFAIEGTANLTRVLMFSLEGVAISLLSGAWHASSRRSAVAAQQLQQSEEHYRLVVEGAKDYAIFMMDKEGIINSWNSGAERVLGYSHDEAVGQPAGMLFTPDDREVGIPQQELIIARHEGSASDERWHLRKDGSRFWATGLVMPLWHPDGQLRGFVKVMRDNTERKFMEDNLRESEERFRSLFAAAPLGVLAVDEAGHILMVNASLAQLFGYQETELVGEQMELLLPERLREQHKKHRRHYAAAPHARPMGLGMDLWGRCKDGNGFPVEVSLSSMQWGGRILKVAFVIDVTRRKEAEDALARQMEALAEAKAELEHVNTQLHHDAFHDALTGLPNRALFLDRLQHVTERFKRHPEASFAVLFLDFDRFKVINDSLGHAVGDALLQGVSQRMAQSLRPADTVARLGGDEFTVLLEDLKSLAEAIVVVERLQQELSQPFELDEHTIHTSASIGIVYCHSEDYPQDILQAADIAMYAAKAQGKGWYAVFDKRMQDEATSLQALEVELRQAVARDELDVHYQPLLLAETRDVVGFEALLRWQHPKLGLVPPMRFIPIAEDTGLIIELDHWVLRRACHQLRYWQQQHPHKAMLSVHVNVSGQHFLRDDLAGFVTSVLEEADIKAENLKLEATESVLLSLSALTVIRDLRALGVEVHIDDFGTGYSSLSYLQKYPVGALKIDRSFISRMLETLESRELVKSMVRMAHNLSMAVIAEGVETSAQLEQLNAFGADYVQGFLFSKPLPAEEAARVFFEQFEERGGAA